jgi:NADH-quinone oxidoreductase subunit K
MTELMLFQLTAMLLLVVGLFGMIIRRSLVGMLISVELMLNGAGLSIVSATQLTEADAVLGQLATLLVMGLAAAEATIVLTIILVVVKRAKTGEADRASELKG